MSLRFVPRKSILSIVKDGRIVVLSLLIGLPTSLQVGCRSTTQQPNAVRDLLIDRIGWQPYSILGDSTEQGNQLQFAITNTSASSKYQQIRLCIDYYTQTGRRLGSDTSVVDTLITPGTLIKFTNQRIGAARPGTERADIRVLSAETE